MQRRCSNCGWLEANPSGAMFCGYSDERTWENESCLAWKDKDEPKSIISTNADRIRNMTDEELANAIVESYGVGTICPLNHTHIFCVLDNGCKSCWLEWLRKEADE